MSSSSNSGYGGTTFYRTEPYKPGSQVSDPAGLSSVTGKRSRAEDSLSATSFSIIEQDSGQQVVSIVGVVDGVAGVNEDAVLQLKFNNSSVSRALLAPCDISPISSNLYDIGTSVFRYRSIYAGNVNINGVGDVLQVTGSSYPNISLRDQTNAGEAVSLMRDHTSNKSILRCTGRLDIETPPNYGRMTFLTNGNIGINNAAPARTLDVSGSVGVRSSSIMMTNNSGNGEVRASSGGQTTNEIIGLSGLGSDAGQLRLSGGGGTSNANKSYIDLFGFNSNYMVFGTGGIERIKIDSAALTPSTVLLNLGSSTAAWNNIYSATGTVLTSDLNAKTSITPLSPEDSLATLLKLHPVSYKFKENSSGRTHTGFISQEVEADLGLQTASDWGFFIKSPARQEEKEVVSPDGETKETEITYYPETYGLRYEELISPMVSTIQYLTKRVVSLEAQLSRFDDLERRMKEVEDTFIQSNETL